MAKKIGLKGFRKNSLASGEAIIESVPTKKRSKQPFIIAGIVVLVGLIGYLGYQFWYTHYGPAFVIDGQKYSRESLKAVRADAAKYKVSASDATDYYVKVSRQQQATKDLDVDVTSDVMVLAAQQLPDLTNIAPPTNVGYSGWVFNNPKLNKWLYLNTYELAQKNELLTEQQGGYKASVYNFPFSRHVLANINDKDAQNPKVIASDRAYAEDAANQYHTQLKNKTIDPLAAADKINADMKLGFGYSANGSGPLTISLSGKQYLDGSGSLTRDYSGGVLDNIKALKQPSLGEIYIIKGAYSTPVDLAFSFVQLDKVVEAKKDLLKQYSQKYNQQKVKVYAK